MSLNQKKNCKGLAILIKQWIWSQKKTTFATKQWSTELQFLESSAEWKFWQGTMQNSFWCFTAHNLWMEVEWIPSQIKYCNHLLHAYIWIPIHMDIKKMCNLEKLQEETWWDLEIWQKNVDPRKLPQEKVIKILIYGVISTINHLQS